MPEHILLIVRIAGFVISGIGLVGVYLAPRIVERRNLAETRKVPLQMQEMMTEEELAKYRHDAAILDVKLRALLIALPGLILIFLGFRS